MSMYETQGRALLQRLIAFLRTDPEAQKRFDYSQWVGKNWQGKTDLSCGTTGCALGWAATLPEFQEAGLHLTVGSRDSKGNAWGSVEYTGGGGCSNGETAGAAVLGLEEIEGYYLFIPYEFEEKATSTYVADKLERFMKARDAKGDFLDREELQQMRMTDRKLCPGIEDEDERIGYEDESNEP